jgi:transcriptional antiterminator RfaH
MKNNWLLVRTKPRREEYAQNNLRRWRSDCETYLPQFKEDKLPRVLFPSYLFVRPENGWMWLRNAWGVASVVMMGNAPAHVPDGVVEELKGKEEEDGLIHLPKRVYRLNQRLTVTAGPFEGCVGLYSGMDAHERIRILLEILGRKTLTLVDKDVVSAV